MWRSNLLTILVSESLDHHFTQLLSQKLNKTEIFFFKNRKTEEKLVMVQKIAGKVVGVQR